MCQQAILLILQHADYKVLSDVEDVAGAVAEV